MRKLSGLFFLSLMLVSTFGYLQFLTILEAQYFHQAEARIIGNEREIAGNMLLRLPLAWPYGHDDEEYVSTRGEVIVEGQLYHFVKKKVYRDTLYIVCLGDEATDVARNAVADFSRSLADRSTQPGANSPRKRTGAFSMIYILSTAAAEYAGRSGHVPLFQETPKDLYRCRSIASVFRPPCRVSPLS